VAVEGASGRSPDVRQSTYASSTRATGKDQLVVSTVAGGDYHARVGGAGRGHAASAAAVRDDRDHHGPNTAAGTWIGTGLVDGTGTYTETFRFAGETIHGTKVLMSPSGTIVLQISNIVVFLDACTVEFKAGSWRITEATGAYARLKARGAPGTTAKSVNVCTGFIDVLHVGTAHYD
jgi:hypothetical protein